MAIKKQKKGVPSSLLGSILGNPKVIAGLVKPLLPLAQEIAKGIVEDQLQQTKKPVKRKTKTTKKAVKKKSKPKSRKLDYRHDRCKCGAVKLKSSKYCRKCSYKKK